MRYIKKILNSISLITLGWIIGIPFGCCIVFGVSLLSPSLVRAISPSWSPDGQNLAFECYYKDFTSKDLEQYGDTEGADICTVSQDGSNLMRLTKDPGADRHPAWSPDGSQIAYVRENGIHLISADGTQRRWLVKGTNLYPLWSPDGKYILFSTNRDIYLVTVAESKVTNLTADLDMDAQSPSWILDGQKIAFISTDYGMSSQMRIMGPDGTDKEVIKDVVYFCGSVSISEKGQLAYIDKSSPTFSCGDGYITGLDDWQPVQLFKAFGGVFAWSHTGRYLAYDGSIGFEVLDTKEGNVQSLTLPAFKNLDRVMSWSSNDRLIAIALRDVGLIESWDFNIHYGLVETWPEVTHIYILDVEYNTMRLLV